MLNVTIDTDKAFLDSLHGAIESNIGNADFSMDELARMLCLGRTKFYRKIREATGRSPNGYLRTIRLRRAAVLLCSTRFNVSEVAYMVGMEPFYFAKCFKAQLGVTPSQYQKSPIVA